MLRYHSFFLFRYRLPISPLEYMFGTETRDHLFTDYFAPSNLITFTASLRPDFSEQTLVSLRSDISPFTMGKVQNRRTTSNSSSSTSNNTGTLVVPTTASNNPSSTFSSSVVSPPPPSNQFSLGIGYSEESKNTVFQGNLHLGNDGSLRSLFSCYLNDYNLGIYTLLPGEYFLHRNYNSRGHHNTTKKNKNNNNEGNVNGNNNSSSSNISSSPSVFLPSNLGTSLYGSTSTRQRYTQTPLLSSSSTDQPTNSVVVSIPNNSNHHHPSSLLPVPIIHHSNTTDTSSSSLLPSSASVACPEIGVRFIDPLQRYSIGTHIGLPFPSSSSSLLTSLSSTTFPFKIWMVGGYTKQETVNYGIQLASDTLRVLYGNNPSSTDPGALSSTIDNSRRRFDFDAAISIGQSPIYEISLALDGYRKEIVAGYTHALTIRRKVYNIFERSNVKGIYQYLTLGIEARKQLELPFTTSLAFASALQFNRSTLAKIRIGQKDISTTLALKTWTDPAVTLCVTGSYDRYYNTNSGIGIHLNIERGGEIDYRKAITGYQTVVENKALIAQDQLSSRITDHVDKKPFDTPVSLGIVPIKRKIMDNNNDEKRFL